MPREIKFRVWNPIKKEWLDNGDGCQEIDFRYSLDCNCLMFDNDSIDIPKGCIPVQFTGLHDRNGKEIYEGDVFELGDNFPSEVYWDTPTGSWKIRELGIVKSRGEEYQRTHEIMGYTILPTVIGNVHENPELLEMKKI